LEGVYQEFVRIVIVPRVSGSTVRAPFFIYPVSFKANAVGMPASTALAGMGYMMPYLSCAAPG
jgi:hypothetical protein